MVNVKWIFVFYFSQYVSADYAHHSFVGIKGGHEIPITDAPFVASLIQVVEKKASNVSRLNVCGGSIVHERFILTAAHCFIWKSLRKLIRVGSSKIHEGTIYEIEKVIIHDNFFINNITLASPHDIALVKLTKNLNFSDTVSKIDLADENFKIEPFTTVNVTGWGQTTMFGNVSKVLRQVSIEVKPIEECTATFPWVTENHICAVTRRKGACKGDSGGPLTLGNLQIGVVSIGIACTNQPGVYVKVPFLHSWIIDTINKNL